ncbi:MAG: 3-hydroxyacyl-CoA dehydrogenase NAD-binding domain-containing protein [Thiolinea sp.]
MQNFLYLEAGSDPAQRIWVNIRIHGNSPGIINADTLTELEQYLAIQQQGCKGLILRFTTDSKQNQTEQPAADLCNDYVKNPALIRQIQQAAEQLQAFTVPTVFILDGCCPLGGNTLALAADYCISSFSQAAEDCFPENQLGLYPAPYAISRLIQRIGSHNALALLCSSQPGISLMQENPGNNFFADACVPAPQLNQAAIKFIDTCPARKQLSLKEKLANHSLLRAPTAAQLERSLQKTGWLRPSRYPAAYELLKFWRQYGSRTDEEALKAYTASLAGLVNTEQGAGLRRTVQLRNQLQGDTPPTPALKHLHLIDRGGNSGTIAGYDGISSRIAAYCLLQGVKVSIQAHRSETGERLIQRITEKLDDKLCGDTSQQSALLKNLHPDPQGEGIKNADMILVVDLANLQDQQEKFAELEEFSRPDAIIATNSSTIPLEKISAALLKPERLLGVHFCYPVDTTPLVEVSVSKVTDPALAQRAAQLLRSINKLPLLINNTPGLLVNRILMQYILHGMQLHQQGVPHTVIDAAARSTGMSAGPLELADLMGLNYCLQVAGAMEKALGITVPYQLINMVQAGKLGQKSGSGFYRYRNNRRLKPARLEWDGNTDALQEKLIRRITEEAAICLEDGVTDDPDLINAGIIFGTGFATWTGDPLNFQYNSSINDGDIP